MQASLSSSEEKINECSGSDGISNFLKLLHLDAFESRFIGEGVTKIKHLADVTVKDLPDIGTIFFLLDCMMYITDLYLPRI